jgi:hypothetical protein
MSTFNKLYAKNASLLGSTSGQVSLAAPSTVTTYSITLPNAVAAGNGYFLTSNTSGVTSWSAPAASPFLDGLQDVVTTYTTPQNVIDISDSTFKFGPSGVQKLVANSTVCDLGDATNKFKDLYVSTSRLYGSTSGYVSLEAPATVTSYSLRFPAAAGSTNQVLTLSGADQIAYSSSLSLTGAITTSSNISTTGSGTITSAGALTVTSGGATITGASSVSGNFTVTGDLTVTGTTTTLNTTNLLVQDPFFGTGSQNSADALDLGWWSKYVSSGTKYCGLFRDASDVNKTFRLFGVTSEDLTSATTVDTSNIDFALADLNLRRLVASSTITAGGQLTVSTGGASITGTTTVAGNLSTTSSGTITSAGALTVSTGGLTVSAGGASITGATSVAGNLSTTSSGTITSAGALTVSAGGLTVSSGGAAITGASTVAGNFATTSSGTITSAGALTVSSGGASITGATSVAGNLSTTSSGTITSAGALTVSAGGASITGTTSVAGSFSTTSSGTITSAGALTVSTGGLTVSAGGASITGATSVAGNLSTTGSGTITSAGALTVSTGGLTVSAGASTFAAGVTVNDALSLRNEVHQVATHTGTSVILGSAGFRVNAFTSTGGSTVTATLPTTPTQGTVFTLINNMSPTATLSIAAGGSDTIDDGTDIGLDLANRYQRVTLQYVGTVWYIV